MTAVTEAASTESKPTSSSSPASGSSIMFGAMLTLIMLVIAIVCASIYFTNLEQSRHATFEKVLNMPNAELESKSVTELNDYRKNIESGNQMLGNATGYDTEVVNRELKRVNDLILKKTAH